MMVCGACSASSSISLQPSVSTSRISSLIAPVHASRIPTRSSSNLGHRMPGVSSRSMPLSTRNHWLPRVTPGRSAALADFLPRMRLMNVDLPTFGMPTTITRTDLPTRPFSFHWAILSASSVRTAPENACVPLPLRLSVWMTAMPCSRKCFAQTAVMFGSARSMRLRIIIRGLPAAISSISGLRDTCGMRASTTSQTASTCLIYSAICRRVFVICPGYH